MATQPWVSVNIGPTVAELQKYRRAVADLEPVLDGPVANAVHAFFEKRFDSGGAYGGSTWAPLAAATLLWRARHNRSAMPILRFTNDLWSSLVKRGSPLGYRVATADSLLLGTSVPYAEVHQTGSADGHIPQREIVPDEVPELETDAWAQLVVDYVESLT